MMLRIYFLTRVSSALRWDRVRPRLLARVGLNILDDTILRTVLGLPGPTFRKVLRTPLALIETFDVQV